MTPHAFIKRVLAALSLSLLITSCASSTNLSLKNSESNDYWYCAPGDKKSWRCAENKESLGLSYYRFWKTMPDPEAEGLEPEDIEQAGDELLVVQGAQMSLSEDPTVPIVNSEDEVAGTNQSKATLSPEAPVDQIRSKPVSSKQAPVQERPERTATEAQPVFGKVLQLAAYHSQEQASSFADSLDEKLKQKPSVIQTRVNGRAYYTVVFDQLNSQKQVDLLINQLAESFPRIQPWLRSRAGFDLSRAD
ncbi:MAG: SPOR domain-containing protein [Kangiella sp.]|nr:SPOR domain-containing protein [Kangiella sp.]